MSNTCVYNIQSTILISGCRENNHRRYKKFATVRSSNFIENPLGELLLSIETYRNFQMNALYCWYFSLSITQQYERRRVPRYMLSNLHKLTKLMKNNFRLLIRFRGKQDATVTFGDYKTRQSRTITLNTQV